MFAEIPKTIDALNAGNFFGCLTEYCGLLFGRNLAADIQVDYG